MNCKQGDLALIIRGPHRGFVECLRAIPQPSSAQDIDGGWWEIRTIGWVYPGNQTDLPIAYPDAFLRPLRDPGDDAIDWVSHRTPRSAGLREDQLSRARRQLVEATSS